MSILKRVDDPDACELPNLAIVARPYEIPESAGRSSVQSQRRRPPTQRTGYFTSYFATLNLKYYKDYVYVPAGCTADFGKPDKPRILHQAESLQNACSVKASGAEIRRILALDDKITAQYNQIIRQRASQPTYHREQFAQRQKEAMQKSAFFQINEQQMVQGAFKRDFLTPQDACMLQGGYKLQHNKNTQIAFQANSFNRVNGRPAEPHAIPQLPVLFSSREALYECAVNSAVVRAIRDDVERARDARENAQNNMQFITEIREAEQRTEPPEPAPETAQETAQEPAPELAPKPAPKPALQAAAALQTAESECHEECFENDWRWEETTEHLGEFGDLDCL